MAGERIEGIENDPLVSTESEYVVDYNMVPGYLKRENSIRGEETLKITPHAHSLKHVEAMLKIGRKKKQERLNGEGAALHSDNVS
jgi:hypothetical protein